MAKNDNTSQTPGIAAVEVESAGGDSRSIVLAVPMTDGSTKNMKRTDYIRERAKSGADRGTIRKEVEKLSGKPVQYQVIFAATKGLYPSKKDGAPAGEGASEGGAVSE